MLKLTYIWAISEGIGDRPVVTGLADVKEADIEYSFLAVGDGKRARGHV